MTRENVDIYNIGDIIITMLHSLVVLMVFGYIWSLNIQEAAYSHKLFLFTQLKNVSVKNTNVAKY